MRELTRMLKAIHAQESKEAARKKAKDVVEQLRAMKLKEATKKVEDGFEETLANKSCRRLPRRQYIQGCVMSQEKIALPNNDTY